MAVENKYVNSDIASGSRVNAAIGNNGSVLRAIVKTFEVAAADDDGSIYRIIKDVQPEMIIKNIIVTNDAITAGTDYDIGFYKSLETGGDVINADALADGLDLSSAHIEGAGISGIAAVAVENVEKKIFELAGDTISTKIKAYDIAFTANTAGTAAGTISVKIEYIVA